jgi:MscS family membrane protein
MRLPRTSSLSVNVMALIAGLGVGGIAVALAAQKTIENLFGGVTLIADRPVRPGDFCRFGDRVGTVEEIGLRSTRVRTLDRTIVTIPNAEFSTLQLENFAERDQIRFHTILGLRYETGSDQLRHVLASVRRLLLSHPRVSADPARVRFVQFGAYSLDLEIFAYVRTADWNEFLAIREDLLLRLMDIVEASGTGFAFPSETHYVARDEGLDTEKARLAAEEIRALREQSSLPLPDYAEETKAELSGSLDYPPKGSALRRG